MGHAWIDGHPVALDEAVAEAARLLGRSRLPVIAGLGTDIAGARAAIALAQRLGGVIDHMHADAVLHDLAVMREAGMMRTSENEARLRADTVLAIGAGLGARPPLAEALLAPPAAADVGPDRTRRVFWLCPGREAAKRAAQRADIRSIGRNADELPVLLAALRARVAGRPVQHAPALTRKLDGLAADLQAARFGVAVWSAAELDPLTIEMLCGLVDDLNARTRFTGVPLTPGDNAVGVMQACGWTTGYPMRTGFGRRRAEHDPWRFDAARLIASGEADCAVWISAYDDMVPKWDGGVPVIALMATAASSQRFARIHIQVGRPALDHDTVEHCGPTGTLVAIPAREPRLTLSVAQALARIASVLPGDGDAHAH